MYLFPLSFFMNFHSIFFPQFFILLFCATLFILGDLVFLWKSCFRVLTGQRGVFFFNIDYVGARKFLILVKDFKSLLLSSYVGGCLVIHVSVWLNSRQRMRIVTVTELKFYGKILLIQFDSQVTKSLLNLLKEQ